MKFVLISSCMIALGLASAAVAAPHGGAMTGSAVNASAMRGMTAPSSSTTTMQHAPVAAGQPNQSCGSMSAPETPGQAVTAQGSAFNPNGTAGTVYAGQQPQNAQNPASVAQYDVACSKQR